MSPDRERRLLIEERNRLIAHLELARRLRKDEFINGLAVGGFAGGVVGLASSMLLLWWTGG